MRDAANDGRKALGILREHYTGNSKPRIISLYTQLTSLVKQSNETVTEYVIRAETAAAALKDAAESVLKGLPEQYKPFVVVVTQREKTHTFTEFKSSLRSFEDTEGARTVAGYSVMKTTAGSAHSQRFNASNVACFKCR